MCECICRFCNVCVCICVDFVGFVSVCVDFIKCGRVYVWILLGV